MLTILLLLAGAGIAGAGVGIFQFGKSYGAPANAAQNLDSKNNSEKK